MARQAERPDWATAGAAPMADAAVAAPVRTALALALITRFCIFRSTRGAGAATHPRDYGTNSAAPIRPTAYIRVRIGRETGFAMPGSAAGLRQNRTSETDRDRQ